MTAKCEECGNAVQGPFVLVSGDKSYCEACSYVIEKIHEVVKYSNPEDRMLK